MMSFSRALSLIGVVVMFGSCTSDIRVISSDLSPDERLLVGKWASDGEIGHWVVARYPDRTFVKEATITFDLSKPPAKFTSRGTWRVNQASYIENYKQVSNPIFNTWIGESSYRILRKISVSDFQYMGEDTPIIIEKRISTLPE